jgi:hypothetical protein
MNDECPVCDRLLPPDGDCYGCAADKAWVEIAALRERLARAEAFITTCSYGWTGPQEGEPFMSFDCDKLDALLAALEAGKESNAG